MKITLPLPLVQLLKVSLPMLFLVLFLGPLQAQTLRIMPLGNSITQGNTEYVSYRYPLWKKLLDAEVDFEFVGSHNENYGGRPTYEAYNGQTFNNRNEGHWGWNTDQILNGNPGERSKQQLSQWMQRYTPDIVLMHLGTNDMFKGEILDEATLNRTLDNLQETVRQIRVKSPNVIILMAQLIPIDYGNGNANRNVSNLNARIPALAQELNTIQSPVVVVDQNTGFDATSGRDTYDGLHPNASGMEKIAQRWFEAIMDQIIVPLPVELVSFKGIATTSGVQLSWSTASEQDNSHFEVQRALDASDFAAIGQVEGAGTTSLTRSYAFEDKEASAGTSYYRLKQVDFSGETSYSNVVAVTTSSDGLAADMRLYPTHTRGDLVTLQLMALQPQEKFNVEIYTLEGKLVKTFAAEADRRGNYAERINPAELQKASLYLVRATFPDRVYLRHLMVD